MKDFQVPSAWRSRLNVDMIASARVSTVVDNLQVPSLVIVAVATLHVAVVVPLLVPELPVVPGISALTHTVR